MSPRPLGYCFRNYVRRWTGIVSAVDRDDVVVVSLSGLDVLISEGRLCVKRGRQLRPFVFGQIWIGRPIEKIANHVGFRIRCPEKRQASWTNSRRRETRCRWRIEIQLGKFDRS